MIRKVFIADGGQTVQASILTAIEKFNDYLITLNNVKLMERFNYSGTAYRYIYLINGFENIYFCVEVANSTGNHYMYVSYKKQSDIHVTSQSDSSNSLIIFPINTTYGNSDGFNAKFISQNNNLLGVCIDPVSGDDLSNRPIPIFVNQTDGKYLIVPPIGSIGNSSYAYTDDSTATRVYLSKKGTLSYSADRTAIMMPKIITLTDMTDNNTLALIIDDVFNIMNIDFWNNSAPVLLEINGTRYRKIGADYSFIYDGDTE